MSASGVDLDAIIVGPVHPPTEEQALATAERVILHAKSLADAELLMEILGLDGTPVDLCGNCGQPDGLPAHKATCGPATAERIMRLANSIGATA